jgi:myo-inositol-1(or 4)-monophosphatase
MEDIKRLLDVAIETAKIGGEILKEGYGTLFEISTKDGKNNIVTEYDFKSEKAIIENIKKHFPNHDILAEESGLNDKNKAEYKWIIDPLDGTVNFSHNLPIFSVSIAVEYKGEIIVGVILHPLLNELFYATKGGGAFMNGKALSVSENDNFDWSILVTGFPYNVNENPRNCLNTFTSIVSRGLPVRRLGSAALDLAYIAAGRFDGFWEANLKPWDVAAGYLLVCEAGGTVTQYDNSPYSIYKETILATNGKIHNTASKIIMETGTVE